MAPESPFLGIQPVTINDTRILISGFWGFSRHINYLGEILQVRACACACACSCGAPLSPLASACVPACVQPLRVCPLVCSPLFLLPLWSQCRASRLFNLVSQALALALPGYLTTGSYLPLLYPLYYVALLFPRQVEVGAGRAALVCQGKTRGGDDCRKGQYGQDKPGGQCAWAETRTIVFRLMLFVCVFRFLQDDKLCEAKYGRAWTQYCIRVPYRIIPFVY